MGTFKTIQMLKCNIIGIMFCLEKIRAQKGQREKKSHVKIKNAVYMVYTLMPTYPFSKWEVSR